MARFGAARFRPKEFDRALQMEARARKRLSVPAPTVSGGGGSGDMLQSTYDPDADGYVDFFRVPQRGGIGTGPLPVASASTRGLFYETTAGLGGARNLYYCIQDTTGGYEWIIVGQSSQ